MNRVSPVSCKPIFAFVSVCLIFLLLSAGCATPSSNDEGLDSSGNEVVPTEPVEDEPSTGDENDTTTGFSAQILESNMVGSGPMVVTVFGGVATDFINKPGLVIYANTDYAVPPEGYSISYSPESTSYHQWRNLENSDQWIELTTTQIVRGIGVQFFADDSQGWARLLLDGAEVWRGDTYGRWTDGTNWACYIEVTGLSEKEHTLRVENRGTPGGANGKVVAVYFFGLRLP